MVGASWLCIFAAPAVAVVDLPWIQNGDLESQVGNDPDEQCCSTHTAYGMPNFKQCDARWKCHPYAGHTGSSTCNETSCEMNNICVSGCGITSSAMLLSYFGFALTPPDIADFFLSEGFRDDLSNVTGATCDGVSHVAICDAAKHWGKSCEESASFDDLETWLQASTAPVIAHVRHGPDYKCKFTRGGHYIVIVGHTADGSGYTVSDPNSCEEARTHGTREELSEECDLVGFVRMYDASASLSV